MKLIKERLSEEIVFSKIPLKDIAAKMGVSPSIISQYKNKKKLPNIENLVRLCEILDVSSDYILGLKIF